MIAFKKIIRPGIISIVIFGLLLLGSTACQIFSDKDKEPSSTFTLSIQASKDINANPYSVTENKKSLKGTPLAFKIIQLKDDSLFKGADNETLVAKLKKTLGTTYLVHDDYEIEPGVFKFVEAEEIKNNTRFIAVLASYHDMEYAVTRAITRVKSRGKEYHILVHFQAKGCSIKKVEG